MNSITLNSNHANVVTPFFPSSKESVVHPVTTSPIAPVDQPNASVKVQSRQEKQPTNNAPVEGGDVEAEEAVAEESKRSARAVEQQLSERELATLRKLKQRDQEVKNHEQAHQAVGGQFAGAANYQYEKGPDGGRYAVSGEVSIRLPSGEGDPQRRMAQADQVIRAALAPAEPSAQDRSVAARATQLKMEAQVELREDSGRDAEKADGEEPSSNAPAAPLAQYAGSSDDYAPGQTLFTRA